MEHHVRHHPVTQTGRQVTAVSDALWEAHVVVFLLQSSTPLESKQVRRTITPGVACQA